MNQIFADTITTSLDPQPALTAWTTSEQETEQLEGLIWEAMLRCTAVPDRSCAADAGNDRSGGRQRYMFAPWVAPHLEQIGEEVRAGMAARAELAAVPATVAATGPVPAPAVEDVPVISAAAAPVATVPQVAVPVIGATSPSAQAPTQVPVIGSAPVAAPAPLAGVTPVAAPAAETVPVIGPDSVKPASATVPVIGATDPAPASESDNDMLRARLNGIEQSLAEAAADARALGQLLDARGR